MYWQVNTGNASGLPKYVHARCRRFLTEMHQNPGDTRPDVTLPLSVMEHINKHVRAVRAPPSPGVAPCPNSSCVCCTFQPCELCHKSEGIAMQCAYNSPNYRCSPVLGDPNGGPQCTARVHAYCAVNERQVRQLVHVSRANCIHLVVLCRQHHNLTAPADDNDDDDDDEVCRIPFFISRTRALTCPLIAFALGTLSSQDFSAAVAPTVGVGAMTRQPNRMLFSTLAAPASGRGRGGRGQSGRGRPRGPRSLRGSDRDFGGSAPGAAARMLSVTLPLAPARRPALGP